MLYYGAGWAGYAYGYYYPPAPCNPYPYIYYYTPLITGGSLLMTAWINFIRFLRFGY